jgi:hypothetical protein
MPDGDEPAIAGRPELDVLLPFTMPARGEHLAARQDQPDRAADVPGRCGR